MKRYLQLINYIGKNYSGFIFISIFYSLWLVFKYASTFNPELQSFTGRMISEATLQGYDIGKRVQAFYKAGALFFFSILLFSIITWRISFFLKELFKAPELKIINYTSLAGIILYFFTLWDSSINTSLELIYCIHKVSITVFVLKKLFFKNINNTQLITIPVYAIAFVLGVSVFFIWNEIAVLFHFFSKADLLLILFVFVVLSSIAILQYVKRRPFIEARSLVSQIAYLLIPIACIPLLSFLKDEIYLILNKHRIYYFSPSLIYIIGLIGICCWIAWRYFRIKKDTTLALAKNTSQLVATRYFPLLVLSIATYTFYSPFLQLSTEMFESGNEFLPIMEFQKFGVIPIIEKFNSHELNDFFFAGIYTFLNGLHGREMLIYDIFFQVLWAILVYYFTCKLTRNAYVAFFLVILLPITEALLPGWHIVALLAIFVLDIFINQKPSLKNHLILFFSFAFLALWRIDVGYAATIAAMVVLLVYRINKTHFNFNKKYFLKTTGIFIGFLLLLLISISIWRNINILDKFREALNYLASAQTYGHISYGNPIDSVFKMQYFVFPIIILLGIGAVIIFFQRYTISKFQRFSYISFLFLAIYYIVNFQRGLIRHSLIEGHDKGLSSFLFFILAANVYLFSFKKTQTYKLLIFLSVAFILVLNYKVPTVQNPQNMYSSFFSKTEQFSALIPEMNFNRSIGDKDFEDKKFGKIKKLIDEQLNENQTFIDFTNAPMLYYYTRKISPSYFYQNPLTIHNDYLQEKFIADLKNYDTPIIIFSNFPENYWDNVDGVPNVLRHYRMAEYFYENFQPFAIIDNLCIWKRNDFKLKNTQKIVFAYSANRNDSLKNNKTFIKGAIKKAKNNYVFKVTDNEFSDKPEQHTIAIHSPSSEININPQYLDVSTKTAYYFYTSTDNEFSFKLKNEAATIQTVNVYSCDYFPDIYSSRPKIVDLNLLPFIWGTYDERVHEEKKLTDLVSEQETLVKNTVNYYSFPTTIDKLSGNTILVTLQCDNESPIPIELMYGSKEDYKGSFLFTIPKGKGEREFAIRISSHYNWYCKTIDYIALLCKEYDGIKINQLKILKGN